MNESGKQTQARSSYIEARFIGAIGTPLTENENLREQGLEIQLADQ